MHAFVRLFEQYVTPLLHVVSYVPGVQVFELLFEQYPHPVDPFAHVCPVFVHTPLPQSQPVVHPSDELFAHTLQLELCVHV